MTRTIQKSKSKEARKYQRRCRAQIRVLDDIYSWARARGLFDADEPITLNGLWVPVFAHSFKTKLVMHPSGVMRMEGQCKVNDCMERARSSSEYEGFWWDLKKIAPEKLVKAANRLADDLQIPLMA